MGEVLPGYIEDIKGFGFEVSGFGSVVRVLEFWISKFGMSKIFDVTSHMLVELPWFKGVQIQGSA